ncbi:BQ5605_C009g05516 [Microbotryum silenes-dioicae]|uniref:BQ5605_C009g05516 protein n=1 Tax=Microbotryum silenes-dioicae TaxID=796604 RepID=A0A2X0N0B5_9BASI|nr:BQ5605_C009g05516 [Microbotryum silenes-dioicae]
MAVDREKEAPAARYALLAWRRRLRPKRTMGHEGPWYPGSRRGHFRHSGPGSGCLGIPRETFPT